jgi:hypothetical protein
MIAGTNMLTESAVELRVPPLALSAASEDDYCRSILASRPAETFWFLAGTGPYETFSRPFRDRDGRWWWRAKPQFAWPLDFFTAYEHRPRVPRGQAMLGRQYPVAPEQANSRVHFNVIRDLTGYGLETVASQKRRAVRKGLRNLDIAPLNPLDAASTEEAREVWNSHVARTGWSTAYEPRAFTRLWRPLADHAGTTVLGARDRSDGLLCAFLVLRTVARCAWIDTIASHTDRLENRPNDAIIFAALHEASRTPGIQHANYFLRCNLPTLEAFKQSLGFRSDGLAARIEINPLVALGLRTLKPRIWQRLLGDPPGTAQPQLKADECSDPGLA